MTSSTARPGVASPAPSPYTDLGADALVQALARPQPVADPYLSASTSLRNRAGRVAWALTWSLLGRPSPRPLHRWRAFVLRCFGARLGPNCHIYPGARIWAPWNLHCDDAVCIADGAVVYNAACITLGSHAVISQDAYLCGASHDIDDPGFPMVSRPIHVGTYAWICARAVVCPGVAVGDGAVLGINSVATRALSPWTVYGGQPARVLRLRERHANSPLDDTRS
jgi:putative colanic acid biosynthesis acetyltransferase WcaF